MYLEPSYRKLFHLSNDWKKDIEQLVMLAGDGKLTLSVIPKNWRAQIVGSADEAIDIETETAIELDDWVELIPKDVKLSVDEGKVIARTVKLENGELAVLVKSSEIFYEKLYVSLAEQERFEKHLKIERMAQHIEAPYMNQNHPYYAPGLEMAVYGWLAMFEAGEYDEARPVVTQLEEWFSDNYPNLDNATYARLVRMTNPFSQGGRPKKKNKNP